MQPLDILRGCNLRDKTQREQALKLQKPQRLRLVVTQSPCTVWSQISRLNFRTPEAKKRLEALRSHDFVFLELAVQMARIQRENGD
jgi:hypothetical protein